MFDPIYRDGAPGNTGHFEAVATDGSSVYKLGSTIYLDATGKAKLCGGATNANKVYGVVAGDADKTDTHVKVLKIEKDFIFKCPITGTNAAKAVKGMKLAINTADYGSVVSAAATLGADYIGATVVETYDAANAGDMIEVRFEN